MDRKEINIPTIVGIVFHLVFFLAYTIILYNPRDQFLFLIPIIGVVSVILPTVGYYLIHRRPRDTFKLLIISGILTQVFLPLVVYSTWVTLPLVNILTLIGSSLFFFASGRLIIQESKHPSLTQVYVLLIAGLVINAIGFSALLWLWVVIYAPYYALVLTLPGLGLGNILSYVSQITSMILAAIFGLIFPIIGEWAIFFGYKEKAAIFLVFTGVMSSLVLYFGGLFIILGGSLITNKTE